MSTALATVDPARIQEAALRSGLINMDAHKAAFVVAVGDSMGIHPALALSQVHLISGKGGTKIVLGAGIQAALLKASGRYNYRVREHTHEVCRIVFLEITPDKRGWEEIGESVYTLDDARAADLLKNHNWRAHPRNMLFARAIVNGVRWHAPDILGGSAYDPDELDGTSSVSVRSYEPAPEPSRPSFTSLPIDMIEVAVEPAPTAKSPQRRFADAIGAVASHVQADIKAVAAAALARFELDSSAALNSEPEPRRTQILADAEALAADEMRARRWWASTQRAPRDWATVNGEFHAVVGEIVGGWPELEFEHIKNAAHTVTRLHAGLPDSAPWTTVPVESMEASIRAMRALNRIEDAGAFTAAWDEWTSAAA